MMYMLLLTNNTDRHLNLYLRTSTVVPRTEATGVIGAPRLESSVLDTYLVSHECRFCRGRL